MMFSEDDVRVRTNPETLRAMELSSDHAVMCEVYENSGDPEYWAWMAWRVGESRCPFCVDLTCPYDWWATCDCFMAPDPDPDHSCEVCIQLEEEFDATESPGDREW